MRMKQKQKQKVHSVIMISINGEPWNSQVVVMHQLVKGLDGRKTVAKPLDRFIS